MGQLILPSSGIIYIDTSVEQIAQGYRRLELIADKVEAQKYPKRSE
ncbi:hypothetical protein [Nostoc sp.]